MATQQHQSADAEEFVRNLMGGSDTVKVAEAVDAAANTPYGDVVSGGAEGVADDLATEVSDRTALTDDFESRIAVVEDLITDLQTSRDDFESRISDEEAISTNVATRLGAEEDKSVDFEDRITALEGA